jgi:hypothetical protein
MVSRWFFLAVVGIALYTYMSQSEPSGAVTANITQSCSIAKRDAATVTFVWPATGPGAQETWFDLSVTAAFEPGWLQAFGPLPPTQTAYALDGLPDGATYYYRANTLYPAGWRETASGSFVASCG